METTRPVPFGGDKIEEWDEDLYMYTAMEAVGKLTDSTICSCKECNHTLIVIKNKPKPNYCSLCGRKIEWGKYLDVKYDICPICKKKFVKDEHEYCDVDGHELERI